MTDDFTRDRQRIRRKMGLDAIPGLLGDGDGVVYEPGRPGFYRVRIANGVNSDGSPRFTQAAPVRLKSGVALAIIPGAGIWLNYDENDELVITGGNSVVQEAQGINQIQQNPLDPYAHGSTNQAEILTLASSPITPPGTQIYVKPWVVYTNGTLNIFNGTLSPNLASVIPGSGLHRAAAIGVMSDYQTVEYAVGTIKATTDPLDISDYREAIGSLTSDTTPAWIYRLHDAQTQIMNGDKWLDVRQMINTASAAQNAAQSAINNILTDSNGDVLSDGNGDVLYE